jgi:hypothetical protein
VFRSGLTTAELFLLLKAVSLGLVTVEELEEWLEFRAFRFRGIGRAFGESGRERDLWWP